MSGPGGALDQVARLLTLVPYLYARGEVTIGEAARVLGVPPTQVVRDLKVLFMVGLPDGYPDDLIDVDLDSLEGPDGDGVIRVSNADYLARPLRLTTNEATAVMVALLALRGGASDDTREVVDRALGKLQAATDGAAAIDPGTEPAGGSPGLRDELERAVRERRQVRLTYWVPARDEETERVVDPRRVVTSGGAAYLDAWCHSAEDDRLFRLDRIHAATVLDTPATRTAGTGPETGAETGGDLFDFASGADRVTLVLDPAARWVVEYYPVEQSRELPDGRTEVDLRVADRRWLTRLLLRLAPHARVRSPEARHQEFIARAEQTLGLYEDGRVQ